ncbi:MAG: ferrochelatase [Thermodesulfobacteriota bacterium]
MTPASGSQAIAILLLNLGGPERGEEVRPFLVNLFSDREIIRLGPALLQPLIARLIAWRRAPKSRANYAEIGGSPLARITAAQGQALAEHLAPCGPFRSFVCMRYWHPRTGACLAQVQAAGIRRLVALTLYPHFSRATTGSSLSELARQLQVGVPDLELAVVREWPTQAGYIRELAAVIAAAWQAAADPAAAVLYSAHSLPAALIEEGDPYLDQIRATIAAVEELTGRPGQLAFQSRSGPVRWLAPSTPDSLRQLAAGGCRTVVVVPVSFVSDHIETLHEIDIQYRQLAHGLGMRLVRTESLNVRPGFIAALGELVLAACRERGWLPVA